MAIFSAGQAVWSQRHQLAAAAGRLRGYMRAVGRSVDLSPNQWAQLTAAALEFRPDLIIELGRGLGNSTCCFLEAAERLSSTQPCRVLSLCLSDDWQRETQHRLAQTCSQDWLARGTILTADVLNFDFAPFVQPSQRVFLFWDAHGFDIAEVVLGRLLPMIGNRPHVVAMHDMTDMRYDGTFRPAYNSAGLWKGERGGESAFWLGHINTHVPQAVSVVDFTGRNRLPLHSAGEDMHQEFAASPEKRAEMKQLLGDEMFRLSAHWFWFSLDEAAGPVVFPPCPPPSAPPPAPIPEPARPGLVYRALRKCRRIAGKVKRAIIPPATPAQR